MELTIIPLIFPDTLSVHVARTGENNLSTHVESITQFKLPNDSHSVIANFLYVVLGRGNNQCQTALGTNNYIMQINCKQLIA